LHGEQAIGHGHAAFGLGCADLRPAADIIPQAELKIAGAGEESGGVLQLPLVGEGRPQRRLRPAGVAVSARVRTNTSK